MRFHLPRLFAAGLVLVFAATVVAQQSGAGKSSKSDKQTKTPGKRGDAKKRETVKRPPTRGKAVSRKPPTAEQVKRVNGFVKTNMPELARLLSVLKSAEPNRYASAIRELYNAVDRLERLKTRDQEGYRLALKSWQLEKQVQLLVARIRMDDSMDAEGELTNLLDKRFDVELELMTRNRDKLAERLKKMDSDIERRRKNHDAEVERHVRNWVKGRAAKGTTPVSDRRSKKPSTRLTDKKGESKSKSETKSKAGTKK